MTFKYGINTDMHENQCTQEESYRQVKEKLYTSVSSRNKSVWFHSFKMGNKRVQGRGRPPALGFLNPTGRRETARLGL